MAKFDSFLSLDRARVEGVGAQSKERKGSKLAAQHSGVIVQKPKVPNTYELKIWLLQSGNYVFAHKKKFIKHSIAVGLRLSRTTAMQRCAWLICQLAAETGPRKRAGGPAYQMQ